MPTLAVRELIARCKSDSDPTCPTSRPSLFYPVTRPSPKHPPLSKPNFHPRGSTTLPRFVLAACTPRGPCGGWFESSPCPSAAMAS
eukprot:scaffold282580_cov28-Tisochrysis_lutea.AAC.4